MKKGGKLMKKKFKGGKEKEIMEMIKKKLR